MVFIVLIKINELSTLRNLGTWKSAKSYLMTLFDNYYIDISTEMVAITLFITI